MDGRDFANGIGNAMAALAVIGFVVGSVVALGGYFLISWLCELLSFSWT